MAIVWGLDMGTNSLGWAIVDTELKKIVDAGVRIFSEGVNEVNTDKEMSKNSARRMFRQMRRHYDRRRMRKASLFNNLQKAGLAPDDPSLRDAFMSMEPYSLRSRGLTDKLDLFEIGRLFYHLNQRRGFKSNRKADAKDNESGVVKETIRQVQNEMLGEGAQTLGEHFHQKLQRGEKVRGTYTSRAMYHDEFEVIFEKQAAHYPDILNEKLKTTLSDKGIFFQRPLKSQKGIVGKCHFEPGKKRAPKASMLFQEFRIWQQLNSLTLVGGDRMSDEDAVLTLEQRKLLADYLRTSSPIRLDEGKGITDICNYIGLPKLKHARYEANLRTLNGNSSLARIWKAIGKEKFRSLQANDLDDMIHLLQFATDEDITAARASVRWGLDITQATNFAKITLENGYASISSKAIKRILPFLKQGELYHHACLSAGYHHSQEDEVEVTDEMPRIDTKELRNPIVVVALNQVRLVCNELIRVHGHPDVIRVEMARELRLPKGQRVEIEKNNRKLEKEAEVISKRLKIEIGLEQPSRNDIIRYRLWQEAHEMCPYSGETISLHRLFHEDVDIEHIHPYSRTLDDSQANKTICVRTANIEKGDRTPYEWLHGSTQYDAMVERVKRSSMSPGKKRKFTMTTEAFKERNANFIERQLNDTRYIARSARKHLRYLCNNVGVGNGSVTAVLRWQWGLDATINDGTISRKNRADHRHHAIDAICIAFSSASLMQRMSTLHGKHGVLDRNKHKIEFPWPNFRKDVESTVDEIIVSHKVNKRVRGQMHEATFYGQMRQPFANIPLTNDQGVPFYVCRKALNSITDTNAIYKIVDPKIKEAVFNRLISLGIHREDLEAERKIGIPSQAFVAPLLFASKSGSGSNIQRVRIMEPASNKVKLKSWNIWVEPGANHHYAIYRDENGKQVGDIVTLFEAYRREKEGLPVINHKPSRDLEFVCSLQIREMWLLDIEDVQIDALAKLQRRELARRLYYVQKMTKGKITLNLHTNVGEFHPQSRQRLAFNKSPATLRGVKVIISPAGRISVDRS